jgi:hypothetical protein
MRAWAALLDRLATPERPVILAIHPGTRLALERAGVGLGPRLRGRSPGLSHRAHLQLHATAVLTDSRCQRQAAWLRSVPGPARRDRGSGRSRIRRADGGRRLCDRP